MTGVGPRQAHARALLGLGDRDLVLASASPRRAEILGNLGLVLDLRPTHVDETLPEGVPAIEAATLVAERKARAAHREGGDAVVLAADTLVVVEGEALGKPGDDAEAREMLRRLAGRSHEVATGVALLCERSGALRSGVEVTRVHFRDLAPADIDALVGSGESRDKAGAYGIQGLAALAVDGIEGDYFNVVGLPLVLVRRLLLELREAS